MIQPFRLPLLLFAAALCLAGPPQDAPSSAPPYRSAARAEQILQCRTPGQEKISDPAAAAYAQLEQAISLTRVADPSVKTETLGAFRALTTKRLAEVSESQAAWNQALAKAMELERRAALDQAMAILVKAAPLECDARFREFSRRLKDALQKVSERITEGDRLLEAARSSLRERQVVRFAREAAEQFRTARGLNLDNRDAPARLQEAVELAAAFSAIDKRDVLIFSNPGAAGVIVHADGAEDRRCPLTPCKFRFENYLFDASGGMFLNAKRHTSPIEARLEKAGYLPASVTLTHKAVWDASVPGEHLAIDYYYFERSRFEINLEPLRTYR